MSDSPAGPGMPNWLSDDEQRSWRGLVQAFMRLPPILQVDAQRSGLTMFE